MTTLLGINFLYFLIFYFYTKYLRLGTSNKSLYNPNFHGYKCMTMASGESLLARDTTMTGVLEREENIDRR